MSRPARAATRVARRVYRALLRLHHAADAGYAPQMAATFDTLLERTAPLGLVAVGRLAIRESLSLILTSPARTAFEPRPQVPARARRPFAMETLSQDLRFAWRGFRRRPMFTAALVLTLALGIGANTAIFSVVNAVLLQRLPFQNPDRLVAVWEDATAVGFPRNTPAPGNYSDWKSEIRAFDGVAALTMREFNVAGDGEPEQIRGAGVTANLFSVLGAQPLIGRAWTAEEDAPGSRVAVLSYGLWQRRFAGDASVINRSVSFNGTPYTVIGVMPARFQVVSPELQIWVPAGFTAEELGNRGNHFLQVIARLKPEATLEQANAELAGLAERSQKAYPETNRQMGMYAVSLLDDYVGDTRAILWVLLGAVACVLLVACANVANLLLASALDRSKDMAVRAALGADRRRLVRQLLTESTLLAAIGGVAGVVVAQLSFGTLAQLVPAPLADLSNIGLDARVLAATAAITMLTGVLFGLAPAWRASRVDVGAASGHSSARGVVGGATRLRNALVVAEIALATVLLVGAGLFLQSFRSISRVDLGFTPDRVLTARIQLPRTQYGEPGVRVQFVTSVLERVRALPGVTSAGYTSAVPLVWRGGTSGFLPEAQPVNRQLSYDAINRVVSTGYMETIGMRLRAGGRFFTEADTDASEPVAIINERMAAEYWPGVDALGKRFRPGSEGASAPWRTIVGITANTAVRGIDQPAKAEMFFPLAQSGNNWMWPRDLAIRVNGDPAALANDVRRAVWSLDPVQPVSRVQTLADIVDTELEVRRLQMTLMTAFAGLGLLLASIGVYGVLSYSVSTRRREIGLRLALGGEPRRVRALVVRQGMTLMLIGLTIGLIVAASASSLVGALLFRVSAHDPIAFAAQAGIIALACFLAAYIPARRASRIDPMTALRID